MLASTHVACALLENWMSSVKQNRLGKKSVPVQRLSVAVFLSALLVVAAAPAAAVVVDNFETDQAAVDDPPGGNATSVSEATPDDILGDNRDLRSARVAGSGTVSSVVTAGSFDFTISDTTPDTEGQGVITWDGDTDPNTFDPVGLANQDLTAMNHSAFRVRVENATAGAEIMVQVFTDGSNASLSFLVLPAVGATQDFFMPFSEFIISAGLGADFTDVGAITMSVQGTEASVSLGLFDTVAPTIEVTMQDRDPMTNLPIMGSLMPGDTIKYRVEITNTGGEALAVDFANTVDANTTLDMASVDVFGIARNDSYRTLGNTQLVPSIAEGVLANDSDPDSGTPPMPGEAVKCVHIAMEAEKCKVVIASSDVASSSGGTINWLDTDPAPADGMGDGHFEYTPALGFTGIDTFNYTMTDDEGNTATGSVSVLVGPTVWFVDDDAGASLNLGNQVHPFNSIASMNTNLNGAGGAGDVDAPGDIIFFFNGGDNNLAFSRALELEDGQQILGEGSGLSLGGTVYVAPDAANDPVLSAATDNAIELGSNNTLRGLTIGNTMGFGILGNGFGTLTVDNLAINGNGGALGLTNGVAAVTLENIASTGAVGRGIDLDGVSGSVTVAGTTSITNPEGTGIRVVNGGSTYDFGATTITGAGNTAGNGIELASSATSTFTFDSLSVTTDNGTGLLANNAGTVNIGGAGATINATGGAGVDVTSTALDNGVGGGGVTFASVTSTNSPVTGINLVNVMGSFTANGGSISGATGTAFNVGSATNLFGGGGDVTYTGSITNTSGRSISIRERTGGDVTLSGTINDTGTGLLAMNNNNGSANTITLSGGSKVFNTGTSIAIDLDNNDDATINFNGGGLDLDTTTATAFDATGGAAGINVAGSGNTVATTTGTAVNITDSTIGGAGVAFLSINTTAVGSNVGIVLDDTGAGTFTVTGSGTTGGSGGTISNKTADAVTLNNTDGLVNLRNMIFEDIGDMSGGFDQSSGHDAIHGQIVDGGLRLDNVTIRRISDQAINGTLLVDGVTTTTWTGLDIRDSTIEDTNRFHVANVADSQADEAMVKILGLRGTVNLDNNTLRRGIELLDITTAGSGTMTMTVTRNAFSTAFKEFTTGAVPAVGRSCIDINVDGSSTTTVTIGDEANGALGNSFLNCGIASIRLVKAITTAGNANIDFIIARNSFRSNDKSSTMGTAGNFPQGGVALRAGPGGIATFDTIVSRNTFGVFVPPDDRMGSTTDEIMNADGVEGNLVMIFENGVSQARVDNNEFNGSINAPWLTRADNNTDAAVLFQNNLYRGRDDFFSPDPGFGTFTVPGVPSRTRVRGGGNLDLTFRNETFVEHDQFFFAQTEVAEFEVLNLGPGGSGAPPFGGNLCLHFDAVVSPDGFEFEEQAGTIELFQGANNAAATGPCTVGSTGDCEAEMADDGNRGGPTTRNQATGTPSAALNPPFVDVDAGSISITGTQCTEPSGGIF